MPDAAATLREALADRYAIQRELGAGGMATVYLAEDLKHRRQVAVKVLRPELAAVLGPDRFLREIEIAARLQHPHILPLFDSGHAGGFLYYVMPYVEGESLRARLVRERGALPIPEAARVLRDVADALAHAHARGVVHRDIKPENVMLSGRHALVTDFGVAKAVSEASGRQQLTTAGVALGTPAYMAPEQAAADPNMDHRVDVYALGCVAYELLAGRVPFDKASPQATLAAHVTEAVEPVSKHRGTIPPAMSQLVMKCLEKRPADRWQKAEELIPPLETMTTPTVGITPTDTRPISAILPAGSRRWSIAAALGLVAVFALWRAGMTGPGSTATPLPVRLAVMQFQNMGPERDAFFADGMMDAVHAEIRRIPGLTVLGLQAAAQYKVSAELSLQDIGHKLGADYLLTARIHWDGQLGAGSQVRVSAELVRAADQTSQWKDSYQREFKDIFALQSTIAGAVATAIGRTLGQPDSAARPLVAYVPKPEAILPYAKGVAAMKLLSTQGYDAAVRFFEQATRADSSYARAWAGLARARALLGDGDQSKAAADRALSLDSLSSEAYEALSMRQLQVEWDFAAGEQSCRQAIRLDPNNAFAYGRCAQVTAILGRYRESIEFGERYAALDPFVGGDVPLYGMFALQRYDDVIARARKGLADDSLDTPNGYYRFLGQALLEKGDTEAALQALERAALRTGVAWEYGWAVARAGRIGDARALLGRALGAVPTASSPAQNGSARRRVAAIYANLGVSDSAFLWLDRAMLYPGRNTAELRWRPEWNPLRSDPRFNEVLRKIGLEK